MYFPPHMNKWQIFDIQIQFKIDFVIYKSFLYFFHIINLKFWNVQDFQDNVN
jgi:hypothetical protein